MANQTETRVTRWYDYPHFGQTAYRIWFRMTSFGTIQQRHEWKGEGVDPRMEAWIDTPTRSFPANAEPVGEAA